MIKIILFRFILDKKLFRLGEELITHDTNEFND
jgi:hypothetical protein